MQYRNIVSGLASARHNPATFFANSWCFPKLERISPLVSQNDATRYQDFLQKFPQLANRVPLGHLASYLGMTQSSLSRIRKNIR